MSTIIRLPVLLAALCLGLFAISRAWTLEARAAAEIEPPERNARAREDARAMRVRIDVGPASLGEIEAVVGVPFQLFATAELQGGSRRGVGESATWTSSDTTVLRISDGSDGRPAGLALPLRRGRAGVVVTYPKLDGLPPHRVSEVVGDSVLVIVREPS